MAQTNLSKFLRPILERVAIRKVGQLQAALDRKDVNDLGKLRKSIRAKVVIQSTGDFRIDFLWERYGDVLNTSSNDMGFLGASGNARLVAWVRRKISLREFEAENYKSSSKKRTDLYLAKRVAFLIQRSWSRGARFPSSRFGSKGWASQAFNSTEIANLRKLTQDSLSTAFSQYVKQLNNDRKKQKTKTSRG